MAINTTSQTTNPEITKLKMPTNTSTTNIFSSGSTTGPSIFSGVKSESTSVAEDLFNNPSTSNQSDSLLGGFSKFISGIFNKTDQTQNDDALIAKNRQVLADSLKGLNGADVAIAAADALINGYSVNKAQKAHS